MSAYWLEQVSADVSAEEHWLSPGERECLRAMRFPKRRADWRLGRWTAKRALAAFLALPGRAGDLAGIEIRAAPSGAPEAFFGGRPAPVAISLSHSGGVALCVLGPRGSPVGCDLERVEPRSAAFLSDWFTRAEQQLVRAAPFAVRPRLVTLLWSAKESVLKALHAGLRLDTRSVEIAPSGIRTHAGEFHANLDDGRSFHGWWESCEGYVRTITAKYPPQPLVLLGTAESRFQPARNG